MSKPNDKKKARAAHWGHVSSVQMVKLFDRESDLDHVFAKDVYTERQEEIDECAKHAGFVKVKGTHKTSTVFQKK